MELRDAARMILSESAAHPELLRVTGRGAPDAERPWDEIVPGLWMGGHRYAPPSGELTPAIVADEFGVVISMHRQRVRRLPDDRARRGLAAHRARRLLRGRRPHVASVARKVRR